MDTAMFTHPPSSPFLHISISKMKILHVITSMRQGGAERLVSQLLPRFREAGEDAQLAVLDGTDTPFLRQLLDKGIHVHILGVGYRGIYSPANICHLRKLIKGGFDVIHTHNTAAQLFTAIASIRHSRNILVTTEHNTTNRRRSWRLYRRIDRWMYRRYDAIICCSQPTEKALVTNLGPDFTGRISTINNGIDLTSFDNDKRIGGIRRPSADITTPSVNILMVAAFRPQKDHITPLKALTRLPEYVTLTYAGDGVTRRNTEQEAARLGVADRVRFLGNVDNIPAIYRSADIALLSTHYEGLSLSTIEAMASGIPLITSDAPGVSEAVGNGALLFPIGDDAALARQITALINDPGLYAATSDKGRDRASIYDIDTTANAYLDLYSTLLSHHS